jgi:hypothetical protein
MTKTAISTPSAARRWTPAHTFFTALGVVAAVPILVSAVDNPAGPYLAAYVSTALVMFGLYEFARRLRRREPIGRIWAVLGAGILTGFFVNLATILGPNIYLVFLVGQALSVGLVLWLVRATAAPDQAPARR